MRLSCPTQPDEPPTMIRADLVDVLEIPARSSIANLGGAACRLHHRAHDFDMRAAPAQIVTQRLHGLALGGVRIAQQQRFGRHDHAVEAVTALRGLFPDEGSLRRIGTRARAEALECQDLAIDTAADRNHAGAGGEAVDQHRAGAAFTEPAAVFRSIQFKIVAQYIQQRSIGSRIDVMDPAVDGQADRGLRHAHGFRRDDCTANIAQKTLPEDTVCIQTCKHAFPRRKLLPGLWTERRGNWGFIRQRSFWSQTPLDRFSRRAQDCSYTNEYTR